MWTVPVTIVGILFVRGHLAHQVPVHLRPANLRDPCDHDGLTTVAGHVEPDRASRQASDFIEGRRSSAIPLGWANLDSTPITATGATLYIRGLGRPVNANGVQWYVNAIRVRGQHGLDHNLSVRPGRLLRRVAEPELPHLHRAGHVPRDDDQIRPHRGRAGLPCQRERHPIGLAALGFGQCRHHSVTRGPIPTRCRHSARAAGRCPATDPRTLRLDPAVSIVHTNPGGNYPSISTPRLNGGRRSCSRGRPPWGARVPSSTGSSTRPPRSSVRADQRHQFLSRQHRPRRLYPPPDSSAASSGSATAPPPRRGEVRLHRLNPWISNSP